MAAKVLSPRPAILKIFAMLGLALAFLLPAQGQIFDFEKDRVPMAVLDGSLRFHPGDDSDGKLGWASPNFDDSSWPLILAKDGWDEHGYKNLTGIAWYRFKVVLQPHHGRLAVHIPQVDTSYEIFANGKKIGQVGGLPPHPLIKLRTDEVFPLPNDVGGTVLIALRIWHSPFFAGFSGGLSESPIIGDASVLYSRQSTHEKVLFWSNSGAYSFALIEFLAGLGGLVLFLLRRDESEYLWFGIYQIANASFEVLNANLFLYNVPAALMDFVSNTLLFTGQFCFLVFIHRMLRHRAGLWFRTAAASVACNEIFQIVFDLQFGRISMTLDSVVSAMFTAPFAVAVIVVLVEGALRRDPDSRLLVIPVSLGFFVQFIGAANFIVLSTGNFPAADVFRQSWSSVTEWPFPIGMETIFKAVMQLAIFGILILRYANSRRHEERLIGELEAARVVQQVLVPAKQPTIPGFGVSCIYMPAGQVGGDFFQLMPTPGEGGIVIIGDVSGKGLPAAMTVSLLVGTFRTLVHYTQSPAEILTAMNQRLLDRSNGGFTTCLVLRLDPEGPVTAANAGHISPYLNGKEVSVANGLPLGLVAEFVYPESTFAIPPDAQLTLLTDGIVEARSKTGELFGFERTAAISAEAAEVIARTAKQFGQEDDITVLCLRRLSIGREHAQHPAMLDSSSAASQA
jgi:sigma-B regulation protein RsbU (phosphoserine phosphatase)